jgi:hypothetical protein
MGRSYSQKDTNPKDQIGSTKLPLDLVPSTLEVYAALAFLEGALKYGRFNWRIAGVRTSIYLSALKRHLKKFEDGEWDDRKTKVPHLASILACTGIILDAFSCGKLNDDRAPAAPDTGDIIDEMAPFVAHLKELFKDHNPHQYTIRDSEHAHTRIDGSVLSEISRELEGQKRPSCTKPRKTRSRSTRRRSQR